MKKNIGSQLGIIESVLDIVSSQTESFVTIHGLCRE